MINDRPQYCLLTGPSRSGNHYLHSLLDSHPQLLISPEEDFFVDFMIRRHRTSFLRELASNRDLLFPKFCIDKLLSMNKEDNWQKLTSGEKAPQHNFSEEIPFNYKRYQELLRSNMPLLYKGCSDIVLRYLDCLFQAVETPLNNHTDYQFVYMCPNIKEGLRFFISELKCKVLIIIRDPVQRTASLIKSRKNVTTDHQIKTVDNLIKYFEHVLLLLNDPILSQQILVLDYSYLKGQTEHVMSSVASFLEMQFHANLIQATLYGKPTTPNTSFKNNEVEKFSNKPGGYIKEVLDESTIEYIQQAAHPVYLKLRDIAVQNPQTMK